MTSTMDFAVDVQHIMKLTGGCYNALIRSSVDQQATMTRDNGHHIGELSTCFISIMQTTLHFISRIATLNTLLH